MNSFYNLLQKEKEFRLLWFGYTLTVFGEWFAVIAVNLYVWNSYESMILSSVSLAINMVPTVFLGPLLGGVVDRCSKKKLAILLSVLNCGVLMIPILFKNIYAVCMFNFLIGVASCVRYPWMNSYLPSVVKEDDLLNANSLISLSKTSGQLIMPLLSGLLMAAFSSSILYLLNIVFLILAAAAFSRLSVMKPKEGQKLQKGHLFEILTFKKIFGDKTSMTVSLNIMCLLFLDGATNLLLIVETQSIPGKADLYYGAATTIKGLGMALASMGAYRWLSGMKKSYIRLLCSLSYFKVLLIFLMGQVAFIPVFILIVFVEAYFWIAITIIEKYVMQSVFPASDRAKIFALYGSMCWLASSAGTICFGFCSEKVGISKAVTIETVLVLLVFMIIHRDKALREG